MSSIYQRVLGSDFQNLHPQIQKRFSLTSGGGTAAIGRGVMDEIWRGPFWTLPFLYIGSWRRIMFPEVGKIIPFTIENYAFTDNFGRDTVTWVRTFQSTRTRQFDAYMIYSEKCGKIIDYLGTHQHLAVEIDLSVDKEGGLCLRSSAQRFYEGPITFSFPMLFSGVANVREWYDDELECFRISVNVSNKTWGKLFGYEGKFQVEWVPMNGEIPAHLLPLRQEKRE